MPLTTVVALIKPSSAYTYYTTKKPITLVRRGKEVKFPKGAVIGLRDAGSKPGAKRLIAPESGDTIIYTVDAEGVKGLMKVLTPAPMRKR